MKKIFDWRIILILIVFLAAFLRLYQLGNIPEGLTNDEADKGYDAYSILRTGHDQWNVFLPISHFQGFGDYPLPVYPYLNVISIAIFGLNQFSVRFMSALSGIFAVICIFFLGRKLFNKKVGLLSAFFLAISPWAIGMSRIGIESNVAIVFLILAILCTVKIKEKKSYGFLAAGLFAISVYTYSAYILFIPLVFLAFAIYYRNKIKKQLFVLPIVIFLLLLLPLFASRTSASVRFSQIGILHNITSIGLINTLNDQRGQCQKAFNGKICKLAFNKFTLFTGEIFENYLSHFSFSTLYNSGTETQYSILPARGLEYLYASILFIIGLMQLLKKREGVLVFLLLLFAPIPDALTGGFNYSRALNMLPFLVLIDSVGANFLLHFFATIKLKQLALVSFALSSLVIVLSTSIFFLNYLTYFNNAYASYSQYGYQNLMTTVYAKKTKYDRIYISRHLNDTKQYIYYLFYNRYDPKRFQKKINVVYHMQSDGWMSIDRIENIYFVEGLPDNSLPPQNEKVLFISTPVDFPKDIPVVFVVRDKLGNILFKAVDLNTFIYFSKGTRRIESMLYYFHYRQTVC